MSADPPFARQATVLASLNGALAAMMAADERVVVIGEDLLDPYGGAFKMTRGLSSRFPARVLTTPISEAAIVGLSVGMAIRGRRPVAELMFGDFTMLAADQLINHAAKFAWMYNDRISVPLVVRTPMGGRRGYGPTHSQSLEKHFLGVPGLWVVAPHVLGDPGALLTQAVAWNHPVLFVESKTCYARRLESSVAGCGLATCSDDEHPFATTTVSAAADRPDVMIFCYGGMTPVCIDALRRLTDDEGIAVDLVVVTQLSPSPVTHLRTILERRRPSLCIYAEEGTRHAGWGAEILAQIDELSEARSDRVTHRRIAAADSPIASSRELESVCLPQVDNLVNTVLSCL
jgi:pyruvate/2-oxoglutarate/acetoin dehydrogenase E1 component